MNSFLSWVAYSRAEAEQMRRIAALGATSETIDEMGLGGIRDAFADHFFPGVTVAMTRLRYFFFVPWLYQELESRRCTSGREVAATLKKLELRLIEALDASGDSRGGVIGTESRETLRRFPSSIYWWPLQRWGISRFAKLDQASFHESFAELKVAARDVLRPDDRGVALLDRSAWDLRLPEPPAEFPRESTFALTAAEAAFLRGRINECCQGTLLDHIARGDAALVGKGPWEYGGLQQLPARLQSDLQLARQFSAVALCANALYLLMLSEAPAGFAGGERRASQARLLVDLAESEEGDVGSFDVDRLWAFLGDHAARLPNGTREFLATWCGRLREKGVERIAGDPVALRCIVAREAKVKPGRARLSSARVGSGSKAVSTAGRMDFRWRTVCNLIEDLRGPGREG